MRWLLLLALLPACTASADDDTGDDDCATPVLLADSDCEAARTFIDVSQSCGPGGDYPDPTLSVTCDGGVMQVVSNTIPSFTFDQVTPNALEEHHHTWAIPLAPVESAAPADVPLAGAAAVAVNGLPIYGPTEAPQMGYRDPVLDQLLDYCGGHTAPGGMYHFHARPDCLFADAAGNTYLVLGWAFDGYPILAPYACSDDACTEVVELQSSWRQVEEVYGTTIENAWDAHEYVDGLGDLDRCNGRALPGGGYAYFATDSFPYFLGCYHGEVTGGEL
ncbi:MAG TPA: YHYH protein [Kofleriaceae bacterium]|jgi:hypothetical protein|nr:YHYH protein [Kofleriaceae bacterium]